jgi:hypothetical protein
MFLKYFYLIIGLNIITNIKCQSRDDEYEDYDAEPQIRTGNEQSFYLFIRVYVSSLKNHLFSLNDLNQQKFPLVVMQYFTVVHSQVQ